jgi:hypothetical protein
MPINRDTAEALLGVMMRHVTIPQLRAIMEDLSEVRGNASFRESVKRLIELAESAEEEEGFNFSKKRKPASPR